MAAAARGRGRVGGGAPGGVPSGAARGRGRGRAGNGGGGNSVGAFLAPHTGKQASKVANAEAGTEFNAPIREAREQAKGSRQREGDLGQWYAQLASDYQGAQNAGASALKSVEDTTSSQLAEAGARSTAEQGALGAQDEQFANLVGGPKDTAGLAKIAQAAQAAGAARVDQAKPTLSAQANFVAQLGGDKAAARMKGIEARQEEQSRRDKIIKELGAIGREKGQARVANKEKIRESDRGYASEIKKLKLAQQQARTAEQAAAASAALAQVESARKAQQSAISNRQSQEGIAISRQNAATSRVSANATAAHYAAETKAGGLTPAEQRAAKRENSGAAITATNLYKSAKKPPKTPESWAAFTQLVASEQGIDPVAAQRAVSQLKSALAAKRSGYDRRLHEGKVKGH